MHRHDSTTNPGVRKERTQNNFRMFCVAAMLAPFAMRCEKVVAADEQSGANPLTEIIVTATKREESLQNVPLSITALSAATIERAGIETFQDYAEKIPNLTFASG